MLKQNNLTGEIKTNKLSTTVDAVQTLTGEILHQRLSGKVSEQRLNTVLSFNIVEVLRGEKTRYEIAFTETNFVKELTRYKLLIPHETHTMGSDFWVKELIRNDKSFKGNVWSQHKTLINGDFVLLADEAFNGLVVLEKK